ncbi:MAG: recombinase family protein [Provencibacterium sp.]|nr:recombinase family protein [Provencibacterium sp.]
MQAAIYSRKSVYTGKGESIENQIEICKQYIAANLPDIPEDRILVFEDEGFSAKNLDRPQFQKMLDAIRQGRFQYLVCYRLDRISRSVGDFAKLIEELNELDVAFISVKEKFDTGSPMGKAMMMITSVFAQLERETLAERVRDNMFMLARRGQWLGGTPPTGYLSEKTEKADVNGRLKTVCKLKADPDEIGTVQIIYQEFLELQKVSGVYGRLIDRGITSRNGRWFSKPGIKQILENPVYCIADKQARDYFIAQGSDVCFSEEDCSDTLGLLSYHKRDYKKKGAPRLDRSEWIIAVGKHRGIASGRQWVAVQEILEANKPSSPQTNAYNDYSLLSGMIRCGQCGRRMFARLRKAKGTGSLFDYICDGKLQGGTKVCGCRNLNGRQTDALVCETLMQYAKEDSSICPLLEKLKRDIQREEAANPLEKTEARMARRRSEIGNLVIQLSQPGVGHALLREISNRVEELTAELEQLTAEKKRMEESREAIAGKHLQLDLIANALSSFQACAKQMSLTEKRTLIKLLLQRIEWDGENLHLFIYGE